MMKGALVEFMSAFGASVPNVIIFQFNPESLRHTLSQATAQTQPGQTGSNPLAIPGVPGETFSFSLSMDVTDQFADPDPSVQADAQTNGIYARLAALEMLLFPTQSSTPSGGSGQTGQSGQGGQGGQSQKRTTPTAQVPTVLFVWGAGRIVPVRVTSLSITEKLYDENLNPTHAEAQLELRVLTPTDLKSLTGTLGQIANGAYQYSQGLRQARAVANLGDSGRAVIGMLGHQKLLGPS